MNTLMIPVILMSYVHSIVVIPAEAGIQRKKLDSLRVVDRVKHGMT